MKILADVRLIEALTSIAKELRGIEADQLTTAEMNISKIAERALQQVASENSHHSH